MTYKIQKILTFDREYFRNINDLIVVKKSYIYLIKHFIR